MKSGQLAKLYALILLVIFGGIVLHAPFSVGFGVLFPSADLLIKSWKEILMILASVIAVVLIVKRKNWREFLEDRILQVAALYAVLHILLASAVLTGITATLAGLAIDLRYILFFVLVYVLMKLAPEYKWWFVKVGMVGAVVVVGFGFLQLFLPADILSHIGYSKETISPYLTVDENPDYIRINSTMRGPNPLGAYVGIVLGLLTAAVVKGKLNLRRRNEALKVAAGTLMALMVLWASYSRSAVGAAGVIIVLIAAIAARQFISRKVWIAGVVVAFAVLGGLIAARDTPFVTHVILHENREGGSPTSSNDGHIESLIDGTERMLAQPIGAGIGSTGSASLLSDEPLIIENQYLFIAHEVGWLGLALFFALNFLVLERLWRQRQDWLSLGVFAGGIGMALIGLLLPVWADDTVSIVWWGLAAVAIGAYQSERKRRVRNKTKQKTKRTT